MPEWLRSLSCCLGNIDLPRDSIESGNVEPLGAPVENGNVEPPDVPIESGNVEPPDVPIESGNVEPLDDSVERPAAAYSGAGVPAEGRLSPSEAVLRMLQGCHDFFLGNHVNGEMPVWTTAQTQAKWLLFKRIHEEDLLQWFQDLKKLLQCERIEALLNDVKPFTRFFLTPRHVVGEGRLLRFTAALFYEPPPVRVSGVFCPEDFKLTLEPKTSVTVSIDKHKQLEKDGVPCKFSPGATSLHYVYKQDDTKKSGTFKNVKQGFEFTMPMHPLPEFIRVLAICSSRVSKASGLANQQECFRHMRREHDMNQYVLKKGGQHIIVPMTSLHERPKKKSPAENNLYAYSPYMHLGDFEGYLAKQTKSKPVSEESLHLFARILKKVAALNQLGVIHRDLKPNNVILMLRGGELDARLIDLGRAHVNEKIKSALANYFYTAPEVLYFLTLSRDELSDKNLKAIHVKFSEAFFKPGKPKPNNFAYTLSKVASTREIYTSTPSHLFCSNIKTDAWAVGIMWLLTLLRTNSVEYTHNEICKAKSVEKLCLQNTNILDWQQQVACGLLHPNPAERMSAEVAWACFPEKYRQIEEQSALSAGAAAGAGGGDAAAGAGASMQLRRFG